MATETLWSFDRDPRRRSIGLRRTLWIGALAVILGAGYAAFYWHFLRIGPTWKLGRITYSLDIERALAHARLRRRPVLLYFWYHGSAHDLLMENGVLNSSSVEDRLARFECVAVPVDRGPFARRNADLQEDLFQEVTLPAFVVVDSDFDPANVSAGKGVVGHSARAGVSEFTQFLDRALERWHAENSTPGR